MILALDPSMRFFGALIIQRDLNPSGCVAKWQATTVSSKSAGKADDDLRRLRKLREFLDMLLPLAGVGVEVVAEQPTGSRGAGGHVCPACQGQHVPGIYRSSKAEGMILDLVDAWAYYRGFALNWVTPRAVKMALLGKPGGSKDEMIAKAAPAFGDGLNLRGLPSQDARETIADCFGIAKAWAKKN